jgi:hypothetical protein
LIDHTKPHPRKTKFFSLKPFSFIKRKPLYTLIVPDFSLHDDLLWLVTGEQPSVTANPKNKHVRVVVAEILRTPNLQCPPSVAYVLAEGRFHDSRSYYKELVTESDPDKKKLNPAPPLSGDQSQKRLSLLSAKLDRRSQKAEASMLTLLRGI